MRAWLLSMSLVACDAQTNRPDAPVANDAPTSDAAVVAMCPDYNAAKNPYWGDLHTHTALSADAYDWGTRALPIDAYRFASEPAAKAQIAAGARSPGPFASIDRKLDFAAVTDHSEWLDATYVCGEQPSGALFDPTSTLATTTACKALRSDGSPSKAVAAADAVLNLACQGGSAQAPACVALTRSAWGGERQAAHDAYQRCAFTSLIGYEWSRVVGGASTHQNVIFGSETVPDTPFDSLEYQQPTELWSALAASCTDAMGCAVLTIPHNSNLSGGQAFALPTGVGALAQMNKYERLVEIHQAKGNSECAAGPKGTDPTCAFEHVGSAEYAPDFVRTALKSGLETYAQTGVDPLQLGIVAATDDHNGMPGSVAESTWQGHEGANDDHPARRLAQPQYNPGGVTGVWAPQNTREDIFAALYRRETFGTSGPRIAVRFYQVWSADDFCTGAFPGNALAAGAVPMGGVMAAPPGPGAVPQLVVSALKDQADLAEVDIIKGAYVGGVLTETVQRFTPGTPHTSWSGGSVCLGWQDAAFTTTGAAFFYARVLEAPTPRWSHYDCLAAPATPGCGSGGALDVMIQERAWTSPIWWLP